MCVCVCVCVCLSKLNLSLFLYSSSTSGRSHNGVRIVQTVSTVQSDSRGGTGRRSYLSVTPQTITNAAVNIRDHLSNSPTAGAAGSTGSHTGPDGSGGLELDSHTSDCSGPYGASVHRGIMRGTQDRSLYSELNGLRMSVHCLLLLLRG